ncbi:TetR/AcrR family transcriptional regulator [Hyphococcus flavus]|uniref:TetR/AcrR family transcriptional regulator n=1 Tax=Hyphococcus flavus TaxID=1866326 RepID=A0AAE9ZCQ2_9PROT|nr:TetR/AcrR family transcriptional regulator [Hyphococcus flavus]WDI32086.1 TetR/AcrR family transcriptional regulator [Hyphococcus flavus]
MADRQVEDLRGVTAAAGTTKARIERAALTLFCQKGVDAVTTREIAQASSISEGALYRHYPSKESLAETMFFAIHTHLADEIHASADQADGIDEKAQAIVATYAHIADDDWTLFAYHLLTTHRFLPFKEEKQRTHKYNPVSLVEEIIADAMKKGELTAGDAAFKAANALGVVLQTALHKIYGRIEDDLTNRKAELSAAVIAVLKA